MRYFSINLSTMFEVPWAGNEENKMYDDLCKGTITMIAAREHRTCGGCRTIIIVTDTTSYNK